MSAIIVQPLKLRGLPSNWRFCNMAYDQKNDHIYVLCDDRNYKYVHNQRTNHNYYLAIITPTETLCHFLDIVNSNSQMIYTPQYGLLICALGGCGVVSVNLNGECKEIFGGLYKYGQKIPYYDLRCRSEYGSGYVYKMCISGNQLYFSGERGFKSFQLDTKTINHLNDLNYTTEYFMILDILPDPIKLGHVYLITRQYIYHMGPKGIDMTVAVMGSNGQLKFEHCDLKQAYKFEPYIVNAAIDHHEDLIIMDKQSIFRINLNGSIDILLKNYPDGTQLNIDQYHTKLNNLSQGVSYVDPNKGLMYLKY